MVVIGGGINGVGIAADAASRGLSVLLCEKDDLASGTSSKSSKLVHGGLRYLKYLDFRLVREALGEREVLIRTAPHLVKPMRFVLPLDHPWWYRWFIRVGLFVYDHLNRSNSLPKTRSLDLDNESLFHDHIKHGFKYSDCWTDDARLVVANAQQAERHGACIRTRTKVVKGGRTPHGWVMTLKHMKTGQQEEILSKCLVNAAGPWAEKLINQTLDRTSVYKLRMIKGSHLVVRKWFDAKHPYILEQKDGRVIFVIPYFEDFLLVGTTDELHTGPLEAVHTTQKEIDYLFDAVHRYFKYRLQKEDIVETFSGVRPLCDDESSNPSAVTRDYTLTHEDEGTDYPIINVFGGKLTTYRKLARQAVNMLQPCFPSMQPCQTDRAILPGGDFGETRIEDFEVTLQERYPFLSPKRIQRYIRSYGTEALTMLEPVNSIEDLGEIFGDHLTEAEVRYLMTHEWAQTANDILKRRSKLGLSMSAENQKRLKCWIKENRDPTWGQAARTEPS